MLAAFKKKIAISNQSLAEKFSKNKRKNVNEEYEQLSKLLDTYKQYFRDVRKHAVECLEPGANLRLRPRVNPNGTHNNPVKEAYPHAEMLLGQCFEKYAKAFDPDSPLGSTLCSLGEGYAQLAEAKNRAADETQSRFVSPISETLDQVLKEIIHLRKKANQLRLAFEVEQNRVQKGSITVNDPAYITAERSYTEAYETSFAAMSNFLECEAEHIELLSNLITAQLGYVQDAQRVLTDMQSSVQAKLQEARSNPRGSHLKTLAKTPGSGGSDTSLSYQMKPAYAEQIPREAECQALYDFVAENPFELSFKENDRIKLIEQVDENWFLGEKDGVEGHFPISYVRVLVPLH